MSFQNHAEAETQLKSFMDKFTGLEGTMAGLGDAVEKEIAAMSAAGDGLSQSSELMLLVIVIVGLLLSVLSAVILRRAISLPLKKVSAYARMHNVFHPAKSLDSRTSTTDRKMKSACWYDRSIQ